MSGSLRRVEDVEEQAQCSTSFTVHHRDARDIAELLSEHLKPDEFVTSTVTSPPYFNLLDYGSAKQIGFGQQYEQYLDDCQDVFGQIFDRTSADGSLWIVADTLLDPSHSPSRLRNVPFDLAARCERAGWTLRDVIIWHKDKTRPWSKAGRLRNAFEYVLYLVKSENFKYRLDRIREATDLAEWWVKYPERYNPRGKAPENVWRFAIPSQGSWANTAIRHACPLPPNLIERMLLLSTDPGDIVCDPFAGSGTVVAEAERLGRRGIGTELNADYVQAYERIVRDEIVLRPRVNDLSLAAKVSADLEVTINKLRAVKIARATWHEFRKENAGELPLPTHVIALAAVNHKRRSAHHLQDVSLTFVLDGSEDDLQAVQSKLKAIATVAPLTKYGIAGDIRVVNAEQIKTESVGELWWYEHGHTWRTQGLTSVEDFLSKEGSPRRMRYPPIASNVRVDVTVGQKPGNIQMPLEAAGDSPTTAGQ